MKGVIQVGAHLAEEYEGYVSLGVENFIFFEPVASTFKKLSRIRPASDKIKLHQLALGNMTGEIEMYIEGEHRGASNSILEPYLHLEQYPDIVFSGKEIVKIDKLDNVAYDRSLYSHLHIDAQGYELEVLKGAVESLKYIETIECEVYKRELYKGCPMIEEVTAFLKEQGFNMTEVFWHGLFWGDAFFSKPNSFFKEFKRRFL